MNSIIETLVKLIEEKRLAEENKATEDFHNKQLANEEQRIKNEQDQVNAAYQLRLGSERQNAADRIIELYSKGVKEMEAPPNEIPSSIPKYQSGNLPPGPVPYDISPEDRSFGTPQRTPFETQIEPTELPNGPLLIKGVIPYEQQRTRTIDEAQLKMQLDALGEGMKAKAKLPSELLLEGTKAANAQELANIRTISAEQIAERNRISAENRTKWTNATRLEIARLQRQNAKVANEDALTDMAMSSALGQAKTPAGNNGMAVNSIRKNLGYVEFTPLRLTKVGGIPRLQSLADRIENEVVPLLAKGGIGATANRITYLTGLPTDLKNKIDSIRLDSLSYAKANGLVGSLSDRDMQAALDKLTSPAITQEQGLDRVLQLRKTIARDTTSNIFAGIPDKQVIDILTQPGMDISPSDIPALDKNGNLVITEEYPKGAPKYDQKNGIWGVYNPSTNKYRRIE